MPAHVELAHQCRAKVIALALMILLDQVDCLLEPSAALAVCHYGEARVAMLMHSQQDMPRGMAVIRLPAAPLIHLPHQPWIRDVQSLRRTQALHNVYGAPLLAAAALVVELQVRR